MTPGRFVYYEIWFGLFVCFYLNCFLSIWWMRSKREFSDSGIVAQCDGINEGISWKRKQPKYTKRQSMKFWKLKHFNWNYRARHQAIKRSRGVQEWAHMGPLTAILHTMTKKTSTTTMKTLIASTITFSILIALLTVEIGEYNWVVYARQIGEFIVSMILSHRNGTTRSCVLRI